MDKSKHAKRRGLHFRKFPISSKIKKVKTNWKHPEVNINFGLSVYGPEKVSFLKVLDTHSVSLQGMLKQAILNKALAEGEDEWNKLGMFGTWSYVYSNFEHSNIGYGFYAFRNESSKRIQVSLEMTKRLNVRFCNFLIIIKLIFSDPRAK